MAPNHLRKRATAIRQGAIRAAESRKEAVVKAQPVRGPQGAHDSANVSPAVSYLLSSFFLKYPHSMAVTITLLPKGVNHQKMAAEVFALYMQHDIIP
jgi:hypothetical protein